tara:strand:+ start:269 stop:649 length:381 start_codon:yes stop_codon:yes gene_type:complete
MTETPHSITVRLDPELIDEIEAYQSTRQLEFKFNRSAAVRDLIKKGLHQTKVIAISENSGFPEKTLEFLLLATMTVAFSSALAFVFFRFGSISWHYVISTISVTFILCAMTLFSLLYRRSKTIGSL